MKQTHLPLVLLLLSLFACKKDDGEESTVKPKMTVEGKLSQQFIALDTASHVPGFAVSIVKNFELVYQEGFGYADIEKERPYTNETVQSIGSLTSTILGAATVKCIENGYFSLNTPINKILPTPIINPKRPEEAIRIKHLVTYKSGILDHPINYPLTYRIHPGQDLSGTGASILINDYHMDEGTPLPLDSVINSYFLPTGHFYHQENFADAAPGDIQIQSQMAATLLAYVIQIQSGHLFEGHTRGSILQPLNMLATGYRRDEFRFDKRATLYLEKDLPIPDYSMDSYFANGMYTCNNNLGKYLEDMTKSTFGQTNTLFADSNYLLLFTPIYDEWIGLHQRGIFWKVNEETIEFYGHNIGVSTFMRIDRITGNGFTVMANIDSRSSDARNIDWDHFLEDVTVLIEEYWAN